MKKLSGIKDRFEKKEKVAENKWEHLKSDITEAYSAMKKVFVK